MIKIFSIFTLLIINSAYSKAKNLHGVNWHDGTVESAFALAKKKNMPIFLYWGASWCPPCHQIKKNIFTKKEFKKEMNHFIPVYLDGDEKRAQYWGEKLGAKGYPTMIVLNSFGKEVTRMPSGLDVKNYTRLLKNARRQENTIATLIKIIDSDKKTLTDTQWSILANYSWEQDYHLQKSFLSEKDKLKNFTKLFRKSPEKYKPSFFFRVISVNEKDILKKQEYKSYLLKLLENEQLVSQNLEAIAYSAASIAKKLQNDKKDQQVQKAIITAMKKLRKQSLSHDQLLTSYFPRLSFFKLNQGEKYKVSKDFKNTLLKVIQNIDKNLTDKYARHSALTTSVWMLMTANMLTEAKALALREVKTSPHAYYYMSYLTALELKLKNYKVALEWSKKGWKNSKGPATRFQWGYNYLSNLLKYNSKDFDSIKKTHSLIMAEYHKYNLPDAGRNKRISDNLNKKIIKWNKENPSHKLKI